MSDLPIWAENLQRILKSRNLQQSEVAEGAHLKRDAFGRYYHGKTKPPAKKLIAIAAALKVRPSEIDPDCIALDDIELDQDEMVMDYSMTPALSRRPGYLHLKVNVELPARIAFKIAEEIEMATGAGIDRPLPDFNLDDE